LFFPFAGREAQYLILLMKMAEYGKKKQPSRNLLNELFFLFAPMALPEPRS
jgi:hypothetical protein